jgi:excisionase family DNA binding protein
MQCCALFHSCGHGKAQINHGARMNGIALPPEGKAYLTVDETAEIARCSPCTVRRAIARRALTAIKRNGRMSRTLIRPADLEAWMRRGTQYAVGEPQ